MRTARVSLVAATATARRTLDRRIGGAGPKAGRYRVTIAATDAAGNVGRPKAVTFTMT